jgi:hypothetical protein
MYQEEEVVEQEANREQIRRIFDSAGDDQRFAAPEVYRHSWGRLNGVVTLNLSNWPEVKPDSLMFASVGEGIVDGDPTAGKFMGDARFTVNNVVPEDGNIRIGVTIDWEEPIVLFVDYMLVQPF